MMPRTFRNSSSFSWLSFSLLLGATACALDPEIENDDPTGGTTVGATLDQNGDGKPDLVDINGDGVVDGVAIDLDGDGVVDGAGLDTNGDGIVDAIDVNGDGIPDPIPGGVGEGVGGSGTNPVGSGGGGGALGTGGTLGTGGGTVDTSLCTNDTLIDDFESAGTFSLFRPYNDGSPGGTMNHTASFSAENASDGSASLHLTGSGYTSWGAGIARTFDPLSECRGRSTGIRFRAKGNGAIVFAAPVKATVPTAEGGTCTSPDGCNASHETSVNLTGSWATYEISWSQLSQPEWGVSASFDADEVLEILWAARPDSMPFDFWIDDVELIDGGDPDEPDGTGGGTNAGDCPLDSILGEASFNEWFKTRRNPFYTYANLCKAIASKPGFAQFANTGNAESDKREVAAFFANVARETGELEYIEQIVKDPPTYFGRGPIQLTHSYNYQAAGDYLGLDLLGNPDLVASDGVVTWQAALWFWMLSDGAGKGTCHNAINSVGFGQTINVINGGLECGGPNEAANQRIQYYENFCSKLGVSPGNNLTCW